jgi:hypothetical protein
VQDALEVIFPNAVFLDPGAYCSELLQGPASDHSQEVRLKTTGNVVTAERAADFARSYLDSGSVIASSMNKQE